MKRSRYSEEQIIGILKEVQARLSVADACRKLGMSQWTLSAWRKKYQWLTVSEAGAAEGAGARTLWRISW